MFKSSNATNKTRGKRVDNSNRKPYRSAELKKLARKGAEIVNGAHVARHVPVLYHRPTRG